MAVIYLKHPAHGAKVATMEAEAIYDEMNGWTRYDPSAVVEAPKVDAAPVNEMVSRPRGRPRLNSQEG